MNKKLNDYKNYIIDKKVAVIGLGISNTPLVKYLCNLGVNVSVFDSAEKTKVSDKIELLKNYNLNYYLGKNYLSNLKSFDVIFKTPIVRPDIPELLAEQQRGAIITSEMEVFLDLCPAEIFAVTGSDGKTTTTTLLYNILKESNYKCWLGGNIGTPLLDKIDKIQESDKVILELSSFQLHTMKNSPNISIVTNISPNHLDVHKSMDEYINCKKNIFRYQSKNNLCVLNYDNEITRKFAEESHASVILFSRIQKLDYGVYIEDDTIVFREKNKTFPIVKTKDILLPGVHNIENFLAAISAVFKYTTPEIIKKVATTFKSVEHRNEFVREFDGVKYFNDSIGSSPTRTIASINSFNDKVILITGGYDKKIPYDSLGITLIKKVKLLILIGQTAPLIENVLMEEIKKHNNIHIPVYHCKTLDAAVLTAKSQAQKNDTVILSPASASFDMFKNFADRGNKFKDLVNKL
ncbi:MAG: UDP-N-acetylmuramoyl-L-alanine--D-glutamate ligase [Clostridiales bacterium]